MLEHHEDDPEVLSEIEKLGYDPRDVHVDSKLAMHAVLLFVSVAICGGLAWAVMAMLDYSQVGSKDVSTVERSQTPSEPYPLLQSNRTAHEDIKHLRVEEDVKKHHFGWVDKEAGVVRIPIEDAMEHVLNEGLPVTQTSTPPALGSAPEGHVTDGPGGDGQ